MKYITFTWVFALAGLAGCTLLGTSTSSGTYSEDLSHHRPVVSSVEQSEELPPEQISQDVEPTEHQTEEISKKLAAISAHNNPSSASGFTIQVYSGTSREQASQVKTQVYKILPDSRPETKYEQPVYKVRVGEFGDRLAAQNDYARLLEEFPEAIVIPARIRLN